MPETKTAHQTPAERNAARRRRKQQQSASHANQLLKVSDRELLNGQKLSDVQRQFNQDHTIRPIISQQIAKDYNNSLSELPKGDGSFVPVGNVLESLKENLVNVNFPNTMVLGEQGIGKTAMVEELLRQSQTPTSNFQIIAVQLKIEMLGALDLNVMISRLRTLFDVMAEIQQATQATYKDIKGAKPFLLAIWIDELHKLNAYGQFGEGSSLALNALKEGTARGAFPIITATTDYEYNANIANDGAFARRFNTVTMYQPTLAMTKDILKSHIKLYQHPSSEKQAIYKTLGFKDWNLQPEDGFFEELVTLADAFVRDQVNPAKSIKILGQAYTHALYTGMPLGHDALMYAFNNEGYNVDSKANPRDIAKLLRDNIIGQDMAVDAVVDAINKSFYTKRDVRRPFMSMLFVGTTGVGKTATAKLLAQGFFGRSDAMITINGGDYTDPESAVDAQHFIGDHMSVNKQQVILLDELEKSHKNVLMGYMRMIDDGIVRDSRGIERGINNTIVIATSNLGHQTFSSIYESMHMDTMNTENIEWTDDLFKEYSRLPNAQAQANWIKDKQDEQHDKFLANLRAAYRAKEETIRDALISGDTNVEKNNGLRNEFLERFQMIVPFFGLTRATVSKIARSKLLKFTKEEAELGYKVIIAQEENHEHWVELFPTINGHKANVPYGTIDPVSVMIAEDIMGADRAKAGARRIDAFIENSVKVKFANKVSDLLAHGQSTDGTFILDTNGHAKFEADAAGELVDVNIEYQPLSA